MDRRAKERAAGPLPGAPRPPEAWPKNPGMGHPMGPNPTIVAERDVINALNELLSEEERRPWYEHEWGHEEGRPPGHVRPTDEAAEIAARERLRRKVDDGTAEKFLPRLWGPGEHALDMRERGAERVKGKTELPADGKRCKGAGDVVPVVRRKVRAFGKEIESCRAVCPLCGRAMALPEGFAGATAPTPNHPPPAGITLPAGEEIVSLHAKDGSLIGYQVTAERTGDGRIPWSGAEFSARTHLDGSRAYGDLVRRKVTCERCHGVNRKACDHCKGTGRVRVTESERWGASIAGMLEWAYPPARRLFDAVRPGEIVAAVLDGREIPAKGKLLAVADGETTRGTHAIRRIVGEAASKVAPAAGAVKVKVAPAGVKRKRGMSEVERAARSASVKGSLAVDEIRAMEARNAAKRAGAAIAAARADRPKLCDPANAPPRAIIAF